MKVTQLPTAERELGVTRVQVESTRTTGATDVRGDGAPVFFAAGDDAAGEFRCSECGYGVVVRTVLPSCPMCRGRSWEQSLASQFAW